MTFRVKTLVIFPIAAMMLASCWFTKETGRALPNCPSKSFSKQAVVFEVLTICATKDVDDEKLRHAANVAAKWLDNDEDGVVDEPLVVDAMKTRQPFVVMTKNAIDRVTMRAVGPALDTRSGQDLGAHETNPPDGERDASQEEIHHIIFNAGWKVAFPELFLDQPGSVLYGQWQQAEAQGHYAYWDPTCDDSCKVTEFFYLATAAYLGSAADLTSDEMRLKNKGQLRDALPQTVALMESRDYDYPKRTWPDGAYAHQGNIAYTPN